MKMPFLAILTAVAALSTLAGAQSGPAKTLQNLDKSGLAIQGHDPVAYFTDGKAVAGNPAFTTKYLGATYRFATVQHKARFDADPPRYVPEFGGYCGYGASRGYPAPVDPEAFTIMNGRLILQNSKSVLARWLMEPDEYLAKARANWPRIVEQHGKVAP